MWGYLLYMGVNDPNGGVKALWALFGIANQMLAAVALATVTTILIKMGRARYAWVTAAPMAWLVITTFSAAVQRVFDADPRIGFLALASATQAKIAAGVVKPEDLSRLQTVIYNNRFDAAIGLVLIAVVALIVIESVRQWYLLLSGRKEARLAEEPRVPSTLATARAIAGGSE
jgi:carbon starvation protein